ncbi:Disaggregatase related [Mariniphaga anaerophila]|uniref:Disaggregatase related n=1 Tax=Mariniphaga anaerophila TaxID=1484053 RepID=A0A1M4Z0H3_9BACT|nr:right-handed parallel beta-helix repeat-containing protein [Mariniphaga anaerophila]SHF11327.1 Disaggregatase related [Mariniphaga anaerophila]
MKTTRFLLYLILMASNLLTNGKEYFVAHYGLDDALGTYTNPFGSIHQACIVAQAGDTVTVFGGEYYIDKQIIPQNSGKAGAWITFRSMPGEKVIFDGQFITYANEKLFTSQSAGLFQITAKEFIHVKELHFRNSYSVGILVGYSSNLPEAAPEEKRNTRNIKIEGCSVNRSFNSGISVWYADSVIVTSCEITRANDIDFCLPETRRGHEAPHEAISICGARHFIISNNHVHHCYKEGIDCKEVSSHGLICNNLVHDVPRQAYYADAWFGLLEDIEFRNNIAHSSAWGFAISVEGKNSEARNIRIHNNLVYNMKGAGILFGLWGENRLRSDIHIYNNTLYKCGSEGWFSGNVGSIDILSTNCRDVYIYNNICDKGFDYEIGFGFKKNELPEALEKQNIIVKNNLVSGTKNKEVRIGQFDAKVIEYIPAENKIGTPKYRNSSFFDFVPVNIPRPKNDDKWKYTPSPWYGAYEPLKMTD